MHHHRFTYWKLIFVVCLLLVSIPGVCRVFGATKIEGKLNINTATVNELVLLPGIGPSKAAIIAAYREENGPFENIEDLINVKGIGRRTLQKLEPYLKLDGDSDLQVVVVDSSTSKDSTAADPESKN